MTRTSYKIGFSLALTAFLLLGLQGRIHASYKLLSVSISTQVPSWRKPAVIGAGIGIAAAGYTGLYFAWYKDYNTGKFHTFNDNGEWLQMDKAGHLMTAYHLSTISIETLRWAGVNERSSRLWGGITGWAYQTGIEVMDGFSRGWGFSWGDMAANTGGTALAIAQDMLWKEQRMRLKFSSSPTSLAQYRPELLGSTFGEQLLKDYNGQTYWLSVNIASFLGQQHSVPKWLNIALGYGAHNMLGGHENPSHPGCYPQLNRIRQYYVSLDIDLSRLPIKAPWFKAVSGVVGFIKIPSPTLEFNSEGQFKMHAFYF